MRITDFDWDTGGTDEQQKRMKDCWDDITQALVKYNCHLFIARTGKKSNGDFMLPLIPNEYLDD